MKVKKKIWTVLLLVCIVLAIPISIVVKSAYGSAKKDSDDVTEPGSVTVINDSWSKKSDTEYKENMSVDDDESFYASSTGSTVEESWTLSNSPGPISTVQCFNVVFKDYDRTTVLDTKTEIPKGGCAELPTKPSKAGVTFMGWEGNYCNVTKDESVRAVYSDEKNIFVVESIFGTVGDTVTFLVSIDGVVKTCGFDFTILYDSNLDLISFDSGLDIVANTGVVKNGISLNFSSASNKTKPREIIELTFKIKDSSKQVLPITIEVNSVKEVSGRHIIDADYVVARGVVKNR